tara:strand:- start:1090 stop:1635 length:546 start_codon:yes stop_codon:yes gene_type:complete
MQNMFNDEITQSIAKTVSDVLEGKKIDVSDYVKQNKDGQFEVVDKKGNVLKAFGRKDEAEGFAYKNLSKLQEVEEPKPEAEKKFKAMHKVKKSGEKEDGTVTKEEVEEVSEKKLSEKSRLNGYLDENPDDLDEDQKAYQAFFKKAMKKFGVESPADFKDDEKKKEFFDYIDKNYKGDNESD